MRHLKKIYVVIVISFLSISSVKAQDIQISQFYQALLFQNPAFAGSSHHSRLSMHQRMQWPSLDAKYVTSMVSYDQYFQQYKSGVGVMAFYDQQGSRNISTSELHLQYAYELHVNRYYSFRAGLQFAYVFRDLNYADLTFPSQFGNDGYLGGPNPLDGLAQETKGFVDLSAGGVFYSPEFWIGIAAHHMNIPNQSFLKNEARLPAKISFSGGYRIMLKDKRSGLAKNNDNLDAVSITPTLHYKFQGKSDQLDIGLYSMYHQIIVGAWYRGLPIKRYETFYNNESIVGLAGYKWHNMSLTYSFDFTLSSLTSVGTGGGHELNLTYIFGKRLGTKKPSKRMPCPNFYVY